VVAEPAMNEDERRPAAVFVIRNSHATGSRDAIHGSEYVDVSGFVYRDPIALNKE
jgi:hypothetical protein